MAFKFFKSFYCTPWVQDGVTFTPDGRILSADTSAGDYFEKRTNFKYDPKLLPKSKTRYHHISGGNLFFVTNKDGKKVAITAQDYNGNCKIRGMEQFYNVDKIIELPRADFHADLFLTPIGDNKILVADDNLMLRNMMIMLERVAKYIEDNPDDEDNEHLKQVGKNIFRAMMNMFNSKNVYLGNGGYDLSADILSKEGFEVIRVPSVYYESYEEVANRNTKLKHKINYSNALTYKNDENEVVLITNKSDLEEELGIDDRFVKKIGVDFEKMFIDAIAPHVKPENIHFLRGDKYKPLSEMIYCYKGGLHCMCAEVPKLG